MADLNDTVMAAFYDLYEDGTNDVITVQTVGEEGRAGHRVGAFTNATQDSDAYFAKIIVLSGELDDFFIFLLMDFEMRRLLR